MSLNNEHTSEIDTDHEISDFKMTPRLLVTTSGCVGVGLESASILISRIIGLLSSMLDITQKW